MKFLPISVVVKVSVALCGVMPAAAFAQEKAGPEKKARVYVTESDSWQSQGTSGGGIVGLAAGFGSVESAGARPQTAEIIKTLGERCPGLMVNYQPDRSDYVVRLDHEGGKGLLSHRNKVVVFVRSSGDSIFSHSTVTLGGSVQGACAAIEKDWLTHGAAVPLAAPVAVDAGLAVEANVPGADIEVDGEFVGNAPSTVSVKAGKHTVVVKKKGYADWSRTMVVSGSDVHLKAELEVKS